MRSSVLFPHPEGPTTETNSPGATSRLASASAVVPPENCLVTPEKRSAGARVAVVMGRLLPVRWQVAGRDCRAVREGSGAGHDAARPPDGAVRARRAERLERVAAGQRDQVGGAARGDPHRRQPEHGARRRGHRLKRGRRVEVTAGHHERGDLERVAAADRVERVAQVVAARRDRGARLAQRRHGGEAARRGRRVVASLQVQVGLRERDDGDPRRGDRLGHPLLRAWRPGRRGSRSGWR